MRKTSFFIRIVLSLLFILGLCMPLITEASSTESGPPEARPAQADVQHLAGRWLRPDGGYVLELKDIREDGSLKASYFNPRPINVHLAKWSREKGVLNLFVELRDTNYPGSKYTVQYDPKTGRLKGTYFQAMEKQTYNIEFFRVQ